LQHISWIFKFQFQFKVWTPC